jgi:sortase A
MVLRWVGRALVAAGTLVLLFIAYQLYGTDILNHHSQAELRRDFEASVHHARMTPEGSAALGLGNPTATATLTMPPKPDLGTGVALIEIPRISLSAVVVQGVEVPDLKKGPGHYPGTPLPGEPGNVVISGHRTTYGRPFYNLDELTTGDPIYLTDPDGSRFTYVVSRTSIVAPTDIAVVSATTDNRLTLTTCNPRYSAAQRLVVVAELQGRPSKQAGTWAVP